MQVKTLLIVCLVIVSSLVQARSYDDVKSSGYIEIAVYKDFPPYSFMENNKPAGIDIEIGKGIGKELNVDVRWLWLVADENLEDDLRNAIWKGHIITRKAADIMLRVPYDREFSYAIDSYGLPKNDLVVIFAPYHQESWAILRDLEQTKDVRTLAIFQYEKLGVELDSLPDFFLSTTLQGRLRNNLLHYTSAFTGIEAMRRGEVSAVVGMRSQMEWGLSTPVKRYDIDNDGLVGMGRGAWDIGVAVKHTYRQLGHTVDAVIEKMVKQGQVDQIFKKYKLSYTMPSTYDTENIRD